MLNTMSEAEKQEGQKTVVSFITGLLIGGLLVWVFSSSPEEVKAPTNETTDIAEVTKNETTNTPNQETTTTNVPAQTITKETVSQTTEVIGDGLIAIVDQKAGSVVDLEAATYPTNGGWVVVRDYAGGVAGNILGAARYNVADGLTATTVHLLRNTKAGNTYQVSFYTDNGDKVFDVADDKQIESFTKTFKAQ